MVATTEQLLAALADLGIAAETHRHPAVFTVEESQRHCAHLPGGHCKNLFLKDSKGKLWLLVTLDNRRVDLKAVRKRIGAGNLSFAKPELMLSVLGVGPGTATPFALINDPEGSVQVVLDAGMLAYERLNYHPLTNDATTAVSPDGLLAFLRATGHEPMVLELDD